jgi:methylglutaconyl-CoA hydratase
MPDTIRLATDPRGVATLTLDRPDKHNAMSGEMIGELTDMAARLAADETVRAVVLTGAGASFCAGGDLGWMRAQMTADAATRAAEARRLATMLGAWDALPKPVVARVQGNAFGGGVGLICVADIAVAADTARFGLTETRLGLIPATIGPYVVARLGPAVRQVFMSSARFGTEDALRLGLIARAVPPEALDAATEAEVAPYLACAPGAVAEAKALARGLLGAPDAARIETTVEALVRRWASPESAEGIAAFFDKRPPAWSDGA